MFRFGTVELLAILGIVILIFGVGRINKIGGELGQGIRSFKKALSSEGHNDNDQP
ncbi:MAG: twin-arginine translocase TatA/TatE family subunit [Anaerolineales bacterium]